MLRIAIDGPGGAGKSTIAKAVAKELGIIYVDTGALYRSIGLFMLDHGISPKDTENVTAALSKLTLEMKFVDGKQIILLCGEDVADKIRTPEVSMAASAVSAIPAVRDYLLDTQRTIAENNDVIMDGRDIGTVILPFAEVKIFLTASPEARAMRRYKELCEKGINTDYDTVLNEMNERDKNDSTRAVAPCVPAEDAVFLDNSDLTFDKSVAAVLKIIKKKIKTRNKRGSFLYNLVTLVIGPFYRLFARVKVVGKHNIPREGANIICCNHIGINDIFVLCSTYPRQLHYLAKKEWFNIPLFSSLIKALGAVSLDRGGKDVGALKNAVKLLESGKNIAIFPQGHRFPGENPANTPFKNGVGLIAYRAHADIVPVCIKVKNEKYRIFRKIEIIYGKPIKYSELGFKNGGYDEYKAAAEKAFLAACALGDYYPAKSSPNTDQEVK